MATYSTEGIILKGRNFSEADKILTIYTQKRGKISAIAKGVRKVTSRKGGNVELFNYCKLFFAEGRNLDILTEAEAIATFQNIKTDLSLTSYAFLLSEIIDRFVPIGEESKRVFNLIYETLKFLDDTQNNQNKRTQEIILLTFSLKFLEEAGFSPHLSSCVACGTEFLSSVLGFSGVTGGALCGECANLEPSSVDVSLRLIKLMRFLQEKNWEEILSAKFAKDLSFDQLAVITKDYIEYILERPLKSADFLKTL